MAEHHEDTTQAPQAIVLEATRVTDVASFWMRHRLSLLLIITILIASFLTVVSMIMYTQSGAAQLDLSRPGYKSVSNQVELDNTTDSFSASGPIDTQIVKDFIETYGQQVEKAKSVDAFNGDPLNPEILF